VAAPPPKTPSADPSQAQDASGRMRSAGDELSDACTALEAEVEELKAKYEMYFLGVELREPAKWREETRKKVLRIKEKFTRNTGLRFRLQSLHARFISYERLWLRSAREREEGTYRRDLFKARLHARGKPAGGAPAPALAKAKAKVAGAPSHEAEDVDLSDLGDGPAEASPPAPPRPAPPAGAAATPGTAAGPPRAGPPVPPPSRAVPARPAAPVTPAPAAPPPVAPALRDRAMRELYDAYVSAKKRCNEDTSRLTFEAVASTVSKQIPEIMKQHNARSVEFKVVIKDGKARLTAVPKL